MNIDKKNGIAPNREKSVIPDIVGVPVKPSYAIIVTASFLPKIIRLIKIRVVTMFLYMQLMVDG